MKNIYKITMVIAGIAVLTIPTSSDLIGAKDKETEQFLLEDPMDPELAPIERGKMFLSVEDALRASAPGVSADKITELNQMREAIVNNILPNILKSKEFGKLLQNAWKGRYGAKVPKQSRGDFAAYLKEIQKNPEAKQKLQRLLKPMKDDLWKYYRIEELAYDGSTFPVDSDTLIDKMARYHDAAAAGVLGRKWIKDINAEFNRWVAKWTERSRGRWKHRIN